MLSGWSADRKRERVREVLEGFALRLANLQSTVSDEYVRSDEFEDLLDQTLRHAAFERSRDKRRMFREFLVGVALQRAVYDEQLRLLRALDELQSGHIGILRAVAADPSSQSYPTAGSSWLQTFMRRLPEMPEATIEDLAGQLKDLRILKRETSSLKTFMSRADDMRNLVTPFGQHFIDFLKADDE